LKEGYIYILNQEEGVVVDGIKINNQKSDFLVVLAVV